MANEEEPGAEPIWPDEVARPTVEFYGIQTASLLANEARWVHRRVEQLELIDERRQRRRVSVDFTLPNLPTVVHNNRQQWLVPVALLRRGLLTRLGVRDEMEKSLPVLTREQNASIASALLDALARETLLEVIDLQTEVDDAVRQDLADIAGARRSNDDHPSDAERRRRTQLAIQAFSSCSNVCFAYRNPRIGRTESASGALARRRDAGLPHDTRGALRGAGTDRQPIGHSTDRQAEL